jgi:hypothetical protein
VQPPVWKLLRKQTEAALARIEQRPPDIAVVYVDDLDFEYVTGFQIINR